MEKRIFEEAKSFIDENQDAKGIMLILTVGDGNILTVVHGISPFERMGIGKWIQDVAYKSIITKPVVEDDETNLAKVYVS